MGPSFHIATFGCKVNQYDSQALREALVAAGCREAPLADSPDFAIVNTCTVTAIADGKARRLIGRGARRARGCRIVVTGCMVDRDAEQFAGLPGVWRVLANAEKPDIADVIAREAPAQGVRLHVQANTLPDAPGKAAEPDEVAEKSADEGVRLCAQANTCADHPDAEPHATAKTLRASVRVSGQTDTSSREAGGGIAGFEGRTRAFVKVQDGCDAWCSYCIVPSVRGEPRSRPMADVLDEVGRLATRFREIVVCGIHVGLYRDDSGADLATLIRAILDRFDVERIRLSSIGPEEITPDLIDLMAERPRFCPHLHMPLQSGSDRVLERMKRRYTRARFLAAVEAVRDRIDRPSITTDVMVGFPGETDDDFAHTVDVCRAAAFSRMHIFPFSPRPGTAAAEMPDPCPPAVVTGRKAALDAVASELALAFKRPFVGETVDVLVETTRHRSGQLCGYTGRYLRVLFDGDDALKGQIVPVRITAAEPDALAGEVAPSC